jgi:carbonic anhydrase/acetyltransferase-like protein (isoleucine patch superfamily)
VSNSLQPRQHVTGNKQAGSLVTIGKEFPAGSMIMGRPAKVVRAMGDEMNVLAKGSADVYVHEGELYRESGVVAKL